MPTEIKCGKINGLPQCIAGKAQKFAYSKKSGGGTDDSCGPSVCYSEEKPLEGM
jgi:hypothetical protein